MSQKRKPILITLLVSCAVLTVAYAEAPDSSTTSNLYYLYTGALKPTDAGVVPVPSRFQWSIETSSKSRVMMRLYDSDQNFTALTAQMDLETAEKLQRDLADIIAKKRQNPDYQYRPKLYDSSQIPTGRFKGINENGEAIIEYEYKKGE